VEENSPAEKAGVKAGDWCWNTTGSAWKGMEQLAGCAGDASGREVKLTVSRNGEPDAAGGGSASAVSLRGISAAAPPLL